MANTSRLTAMSLANYPEILRGVRSTAVHPTKVCKRQVRLLSQTKRESLPLPALNTQTTRSKLGEEQEISSKDEIIRNNYIQTSRRDNTAVEEGDGHTDRRMPGDGTMDCSKWSFDKILNLNADDTSGKLNGANSKLAMDIKVTVEVKPTDKEEAVVTTAGVERQPNIVGIPRARPATAGCLLDTSSGGGSRSSDDHLPGRIQFSHDYLVDEFSQIYSQYKSNQDLPSAGENDDSIQCPSIAKAKELYAASLRRTKSFEDLVKERRSGSDTSRKEIVSLAALSPRHSYDFLGIKTVYGDLLRAFSTSAAHAKDDKKGNDCDKAKKLPCILSSELSDKKGDKGMVQKGVCEKFCMPCCKPARDPPICYYPYIKPKCEKKRPPRPAFSECKLLFALRQVKPCECIRPIVGSCKKKPAESAKCTK